MGKRRVHTERTEAGFRLIVITYGYAKKASIDYRLSSLRRVPDRYFKDRVEADAAFDAEVAASRADPKLGPIIN